MSKYLDRLRALSDEKRIPEQLPKLPKGAFGSNGSIPSECFCPTRPKGKVGESADATHSMFDSARLQREADRRNAVAMRDGTTDRWCVCGRLATLAWPDGEWREVWRCDDCASTAGRD